MSELAIKRNRLVKELGRIDRENYFKNRRLEMIANVENRSQAGESQEAKWLNHLNRRSLIENQLVDDLRKQNLLTKLESILSSTVNGRDVELILVLLGNILIDNVNLDEKEDITKLSLLCYSMTLLQQYAYGENQCKITCLQSIGHNLVSLVRIMTDVDENLGVKCEKVIMIEVVRLMENFIKFWIEVDQKQRNNFQINEVNMVNNILGILYIFLSAKEEYRNEIKLRFSRNFTNFLHILTLHSKIAFKNCLTNQFKILHSGLLQFWYYLSQQIQILKFPFFFETKQYLSIVLKEIYQSKDQKLNSKALGILNNLICQYQFGNICFLLQLMQADVHLKDKIDFFSKLLLPRDNLRPIRLSILRFFLINKEAYTFFQPFFNQFWRQIIDICCQVLRGAFSYSDNEEQALIVLMMCSQIAFEGYFFSKYLKNMGGEALFQQISSNCVEQKRSSLDISKVEAIQEKAEFLLDVLRAEE